MTESIFFEIPLFRSLRKAEAVHLIEMMQEVRLPPDTILFQEGEPGDRLFIILEGFVEAVKAMGTSEELVLRRLGPGEYFGEMCLLHADGVRSASVRTGTAVRLLEMTRDTFDALLNRRPDIGLMVARELSRRLSAFEDGFIRTRRGGTPRETEADSREPAGSAEPRGAEAPGGAAQRHGVPLLRIKTLGGFRVCCGEATVTESEWRGRQPKVLLKAIIARGSQGIPKDVLIEDLWPESDQDSAERNFKVLLHRLRKALRPATSEGTGSPYITLKSHLVSLDDNLCQVDVNTFLSLSARARRRADRGDPGGALLLYRQAAELYGGDFLPEDLYEPWADAKREELRRRFCDLLYETAELHEERGSSKNAIDCYKRVILTDPVSEKAYQRLMLTYSNLGRRGEALKVYDECRKALHNELEVEPDTLTSSIYNRILEAG